MYFNDIKYILIDLKLFKIDLLLNKTITYLKILKNLKQSQGNCYDFSRYVG